MYGEKLLAVESTRDYHDAEFSMNRGHRGHSYRVVYADINGVVKPYSKDIYISQELADAAAQQHVEALLNKGKGAKIVTYDNLIDHMSKMRTERYYCIHMMDKLGREYVGTNEQDQMIDFKDKVTGELYSYNDWRLAIHDTEQIIETSMEWYGYERIETPEDSMATISFQDQVSGQVIGFDGWALAQSRVEELDATHKQIMDAYDRIANEAIDEMTRSNSELGSWMGALVDENNPQNYVEIHITGYSTPPSVDFEMYVVHDNVLKEVTGQNFGLDAYRLDADNLGESLKSVARLAHSDNAREMARAMKYLETDRYSTYVLHSKYSEHSLQEHNEALQAAGYETSPDHTEFMNKKNLQVRAVLETEMNQEFYKYFYAGEQDKEAEAFQKEKGWKKMFASEAQNMNGDTWVVYRNVEDLPKHLQHEAVLQEVAEKNKISEFGKEEKNEAENLQGNKAFEVEKSTSDYVLGNYQFNENGYLHFSIEVDGYELEGLFRVDDKDYPESSWNKLVSIDYGNRHPIIAEKWQDIETNLAEYVAGRQITERVSYAEERMKEWESAHGTELDEKVKEEIKELCSKLEKRGVYFEEALETHLDQYDKRVNGDAMEKLAAEMQETADPFYGKSHQEHLNVKEAEPAQVENIRSSHKGFAYMKNSANPKVVFGESKEKIIELLQKWNRTRTEGFTYDTCNIGRLNEETGKYENYEKMDVRTGKSLQNIYLQIPKGISTEEFNQTVQYFKENGAKFNPYKKQWYIQAEMQGDFRDYLPTENTMKIEPVASHIPAETKEEMKDSVNKNSALHFIQSIDNEYVVDLKNGETLRIGEREMLEAAKLDNPGELTAGQVLEIVEQKVDEHLQLLEEEKYSISVSKEAYDNRCTVYANDGSRIDLFGDQFGVHFPSMEAAEVKEIVKNYMNMENQPEIMKVGDIVTIYAPEYAQNVNGFEEIAGMKEISGELKEITSTQYKLEDENGKSISLDVSHVYDDRQAVVIQRAIAKEFTSEKLDLLGDPKLSAAQMEQIYDGLRDGLSSTQVALYANPSYSAWQMDIYRYGMDNGIPFDSLKDVIQNNAVKPTNWEDSRNMVDKMIKAQRNLIVKDLKDNKMCPEKRLVRKFEKLNGLTGKMHTVKDVMQNLKEGKTFGQEAGNLMKEIGKEVNHQKMRMAKMPAVTQVPVR